MQLLLQLGEVLGQPVDMNVADGIAIFSMQWDAQLVLLTVELPQRFPEDKPTLQLQALRWAQGQVVMRAVQ